MSENTAPESSSSKSTEGNRLANVALVLVIVGLLTLGLTTIIGMVLAVIALRRRPRTAAVIALVAGFLQLILLVVIILVLGTVTAKLVEKNNYEETQDMLVVIFEKTRRYEKEKGSSPVVIGDLVTSGMVTREETIDKYGHEFFFDSREGTVSPIIFSVGPDGRPHTEDDVYRP